MKLRRMLAGLLVSLLGASLASGLVASPARAAEPVGTQSLAAVLLAEGNGTFDRNWGDYDIVTQAVLAVLAAKPDSPVKVLTDGSVALTAFLPNDRAFQLLAFDVTRRWYTSEEKVFTVLAGKLGIDAIESVLLYHVVPGATITAKDAVNADGAKLTTALGPTITVDVVSKRLPLIVLKDRDRNDANPVVLPWALDINRGNVQIAHGIALVLRPSDL
ncbi:MAG: fasciclin domain-containing protein [Propionicimonas sp.]|uniref:fasciclin domain-containing protein n=1 Tax=Propionicimonas sp. TaxID=1955623 RepID=UPI003D0EB6BA